ncbi:MAG: DUF4040 domain-containing protein, partial [Deltaproteobacteria bacterium]|nr:DUF4040 domain-containing protein [Deltaproteobacteria bacterium]
YTTLSALGILTLLLGLGTPLALQAALLYLIAHAAYKGSLFMMAGNVDHEAGSRNLKELAGLKKAMPISALSALLAAASMAGLPLLLGFVAKEFFYGATLDTIFGSPWLSALALISSALMALASGLVTLKVFFGKKITSPQTPHQGPLSLWLGALLLALASLAFGLFPEKTLGPLLALSLKNFGSNLSWQTVHLWHGLTTELILSLITFGLAGLLYWQWKRFRQITGAFKSLSFLKAVKIYDHFIEGLVWIAKQITSLLQNTYLRYYLLSMLAFVLILAFTPWWNSLKELSLKLEPAPSLLDYLLVGLILVATLGTIRARTRLVALLSLGVSGVGVSLIYLTHGAPDLAMTQLLVETLTVLLFVFVLYQLPPFSHFSMGLARLRDGLLSILVGAFITTLLLLSQGDFLNQELKNFFGAYSLSQAQGRNIVNVILVDFRALDTLGEITVLSLAALGVFALLKLKLGKESKP